MGWTVHEDTSIKSIARTPHNAMCGIGWKETWATQHSGQKNTERTHLSYRKNSLDVRWIDAAAVEVIRWQKHPFECHERKVTKGAQTTSGNCANVTTDSIECTRTVHCWRAAWRISKTSGKSSIKQMLIDRNGFRLCVLIGQYGRSPWTRVNFCFAGTNGSRCITHLLTCPKSITFK